MERFQALRAAGRALPLPDVTVYDMAPADGGEPWRVFLHVPPAPPPPRGWPLLAMTDGNAVIGTAVDALRVQASYPAGTDVEYGVVLAVGYPSQGPYDAFRRSFDLSPPPGRSYPPFSPGGPPVLTGGANRFLSFIEAELLPFVETLAPVDPARRTLFGHSFGGLFALHAMFAGSGAFSRFVCASPTIYWEDGVLREGEARFMAQVPTGEITVHLSAGEYEGERLAPFQYGRDDTAERLENLKKAQTASLAQDMANRLGAIPGIRTRYETYAGETHMSLLPVAVSRAVGVAFSRR